MTDLKQELEAAVEQGLAQGVTGQPLGSGYNRARNGAALIPTLAHQLAAVTQHNEDIKLHLDALISGLQQVREKL